IRYPKVDKTQLFNLKDDPYEMNDLAADANQADRVKSLLTAMRGQQKLYRDTASLMLENTRGGGV
ncbi:MAG: choline-sulfatase, partial [Candidatus Hydrogenedentes bacterium]|nr:choline-sulfatase [Candidatus Hydrogenedentota bacterium]